MPSSCMARVSISGIVISSSPTNGLLSGMRAMMVKRPLYSCERLPISTPRSVRTPPGIGAVTEDPNLYRAGQVNHRPVSASKYGSDLPASYSAINCSASSNFPTSQAHCSFAATSGARNNAMIHPKQCAKVAISKPIRAQTTAVRAGLNGTAATENTRKDKPAVPSQIPHSLNVNLSDGVARLAISNRVLRAGTVTIPKGTPRQSKRHAP